MVQNHWTERAQSLLAPLLHAAALDGADMRTVLGWVDRHRALPAQQILSGSDASVARDVLDGIVTTDERELSGIWSTTSGALGGFRDVRHGAYRQRLAGINTSADGQQLTGTSKKGKSLSWPRSKP